MGFLNPAAFAFGAALAVLVLLYLWDRLRRRVAVPSLLLWESVREDPVELRRLRPDWLFYLQAALLSALVLGLARPYFAGGPAGTARRRVLVIDVSASMQAREGRRTRFEMARDQALEIAARQGPEDEAMVIAAAKRPRVIAGFTRDRDAVLAALRSLEPTDTGDGLAAAIALAKRARAADPENTEILAFTDLPESALEPEDRPVVQRFSVGETSDNLAVSALQVYQGPFESPGEARAYVFVHNFSYAEKHGFLSVRLGARTIERTGFTIPGRSSRSFPVAGISSAGLLTAELEAEDALAVDNRAYAWIGEPPRLRLLVVSESPRLPEQLAEIAKALPGVSAEAVAPARYDSRKTASFDAVVFNRVAPDLPESNALYVFPPPGNPALAVGPEEERVEVLDWNDGHEALRGLQPIFSAPLRAARAVHPEAGADPLLWWRSRGGEAPLAFTFARNGKRFACIAFDLEREELLGNDNLDLLLFFLNLLAWLAPADPSAPLLVRTGETAQIPELSDSGPARVTDPRGRAFELESGQTHLETNLAGIYWLRGDGGERAVVANFSDSAESDIGRGAKTAARRAHPEPRAGRLGPKRAFGWWLYLLGGALMAAEWVAWRRTSQWS